MKSFKAVLLLFLLFFINSCGLAEREKQLQEKETFLTQKEQMLVAKEKELTIKEAEIVKREMLLDSSKKSWDSIGVYNEMLIGEWNVKMSCTETSCEGSAIGDTKIEQWQIDYENNQVVAKAFSKKKLLRVYKGIYSNNVLKLSEAENVTETKILVELTPDAKTADKMKGSRVIIQSACKIRYELEMERIPTDRKNITNILK